MNKKTNILFVCTGNTCRSAMAEAIAKFLLKRDGIKGVVVNSAGLQIVQGSEIEPNARQALLDMKVPIRKHVAKQLTRQMCDRATNIITMSSEHKSALHGVANVNTLAEITGGIDLSDPYGCDFAEYRRTADYLLSALSKALDKIVK